MPEKRRSILILEDNPVQSALYEKILTAGGFEVVSITDPLDLVNNLEALPVPDGILLDIVMPGMDGVSVLQRLEQDPRWCTAPAILMTSSPTKDRVVAANQLPVPPEAFLAKPVDPPSMIHLMRTVIASQEPAYLLRQLQRKRLSLKLELREVLEELAHSIRENKDAQGNAEKAVADSRREIQSLQTVRSQLRDAPPETLQALQQQIQKLEDSCQQHRMAAQKAEAQHKEIIRQRQDVLYKQKSIRDIERRIDALTQILKRNKALPQAGDPSSPISGGPAERFQGEGDPAGTGTSTGTHG